MSLIVEIIKHFLEFARDLLYGVFGRNPCWIPNLWKRQPTHKTNRRKSARRTRFQDDCQIDDEDELDTGSLENDPLIESPDHYQMHRPKLEDRFGTVRFRVEFSEKRELLLVTIIDAWDLPPMDGDGKADPYVEVSVRPGTHKKYTTSIKSNCLNPSFNETAELPIKRTEIDEKDLVLKVLDSDYPLQDELIGIIRLPLSALDLSFSAKQYTCLILHEKDKSKGVSTVMSHADAVKLNLKISQQAQEVYDLKVKIKDTEDKLQNLREEHSILKSQKIALEMETVRYENECDLFDNCGPHEPLINVHSAPVSKGSSPVPVRTAAATGVVSNAAAKTNSDSGFSNTSSPNNQACIVAKKSEKSFQLLSHLQTTLVEKDQEITKLRNHIKELKPRLELMSSRNGQIEIGLSFYHISSRLRIDIISANNLRAVNLHGDHSDPFVKVKLFWQNPGGKTDKWKFETKTVWRTINPIWKEHFTFPGEVTEADLPHIHLEITVLDRGRFRSAQPLGKARIGNNVTDDGQHWEEMLKHHGNIVRMVHALKDA